jgi:hypothetical protein
VVWEEEEEGWFAWWSEGVVVVVIAAAVKCARMCGGCFFGALGGVGGLVVDALVLVVGFAHDFLAAAVAVAVAPGISVGW